jgi:hypothetical protein
MLPAARAEVIRGVRDLAQRRGWRAVEDLAAELLSPDGKEPLLLVAGAGVDPVPLRAWIQQLKPTQRIAQVQINGLAATPLRALFAEKLIIVFDCDRPVPASEACTLGAQLRVRPLESFAIVFTRTEQLESHADLELAERTIWRVFGPDSCEDWRGQDLLGRQCYLWTSARPREFLRDRCNRDGTRLAALLRRRTADADAASLERLRMIRLIELADAQCTPAAARDNSYISALRRQREELAKLRRLLARRLQDSTFEICRTAVAALLESQREIVQCMEAACGAPAAARKVARAFSTGSIERLACPPTLEAALRAWHQRIEAVLNGRVGAVNADTRALLCQAHFAWSAGIEVRLPRLEQRRAARVNPSRIDDLLAAEIATFALVGGTALSATLFAAFIVSAALAASVAISRANRTLEHSRRLMRLAVHDVTERAVPEIREAVQAAILGYRERLTSALRKREQELEAACEGARGAEQTVPVDLLDRRQLLEYRCRL